MSKSENKREVLESIDSPKDLKNLSPSLLAQLAKEIRGELVEVVSRNGGHLAPNLGVVELSIAMHYVFNAPKDKFFWDVGHQGYVHKLLTGRRENFKTLRQDDGCSGFLSRSESEYDAFGAGHAGTAISAALGAAAARDLRGGLEKVLAIVGDGSLNCGISLEGLNNISETTKDIILVLNDNKMSISANVGAIPRYLNRIISGRSYNRFKAFAKMMLKRVPHSDEIHRTISRLEEATKSLFVPGVFFEELGIRYIGPIDGHNLHDLILTLQGVKEFNRPVIVHVITEKGRGYSHAEDSPEKFHGLGAFDPDTGKVPQKSPLASFSQAFGDHLCDLAEKEDKVVAITAAMRSGTGLSDFSKRFPDRFYDVGIAEEHALVFAAGLATEGIRPVVAIYSSFLQRALDCLFHDICLQNLPVIICADRSGIVDDGPTHHGILDLAFLRSLPNLAILSPKNSRELRDMLFAAYQHEIPVVIRYPKAELKDHSTDKEIRQIPWGEAEIVKKGDALTIWAMGMEVETALETAKIIEGKNFGTVAVVNVRFISPFDENLLRSQAASMPIATIEDAQVNTGLGAIVDESLINSKHLEIMHFGWDRTIVPHGTVKGIREKFKMTPKAIAESIMDRLEKAESV